MINEGIDLLDSSYGGEVGELIKKFCGKMLFCTCKEQFYMNVFYGYEHEGGIPDASGKKYWVYVECPSCGYQWSWLKFQYKGI